MSSTMCNQCSSLNPITENLIPGADNVYNIGSSTRRWADLYIGDDIILSDESLIRTNTADGADSAQITITPGGVGSGLAPSTRGSYLNMHGNESDSTGSFTLGTGNISAAVAEIRLNGAAGIFRISNASAVTLWETLVATPGIRYTSASFLIFSNTADAADTSVLSLCGGGAASDTRGALAILEGNEAGGRLQLVAGNVSGGTLTLTTGGSTRFTLSDTGSLFYPISNPTAGNAATSVATGNTIDTTVFWQRVTTAGAVTGVILEAGTAHGQRCIITLDKDAGGTITFAAAGTSRVGTGTAAIITVGGMGIFQWDATDAIWAAITD